MSLLVLCFLVIISPFIFFRLFFDDNEDNDNDNDNEDILVFHWIMHLNFQLSYDLSFHDYTQNRENSHI